jgi:hypothetical protein
MNHGRQSTTSVFFNSLLGYVDGQTITIDYLSADGDGERFPALPRNVFGSRPTSSP